MSIKNITIGGKGVKSIIRSSDGAILFQKLVKKSTEFVNVYIQQTQSVFTILALLQDDEGNALPSKTVIATAIDGNNNSTVINLTTASSTTTYPMSGMVENVSTSWGGNAAVGIGMKSVTLYFPGDNEYEECTSIWSKEKKNTEFVDIVLTGQGQNSDIFGLLRDIEGNILSGKTVTVTLDNGNTSSNQTNSGSQLNNRTTNFNIVFGQIPALSISSFTVSFEGDDEYGECTYTYTRS